MQAAQDWFDNVQENKDSAYMELYDTLLELGKPHIKNLNKADGKAVLASIPDKSGKYFSFMFQRRTRQSPRNKLQIVMKQGNPSRSTTKQHKTYESHKPLS